MKLPVYLDHHATTPVDPQVLEAMLPYLREDFGNAASKSHVFGWKAEAAVKKARAQVAALIGATDREILFTSGATESINLALKGVLAAYRDRGDHVVTVATEHRAGLDTCRRLERMRDEGLENLQRLRLLEREPGVALTPETIPELAAKHQLDKDPVLQQWVAAGVGAGARVTVLGVQPDGRVSLEAVEAALTDRTVVVSVMWANNEIGTLQPIEEIGRLCRARGVLFHCDAVQGVGKLPFNVDRANADLVSLSAHKLYGPKGIGALYVRDKPRVRLAALIDGGGHERGMRSGTLNVPGIVGFGKAAELAKDSLSTEPARLLALRERLWTRLSEGLEGLSLNGSLEHRLPGNLNVSFDYVEADALLAALHDVALSSGSACSSASLEPSYVLKALGLPDARAKGSIRFGIGRFNTDEEIDFAAQRVVETVRRLRSTHPLYRLAQEGIELTARTPGS